MTSTVVENDENKNTSNDELSALSTAGKITDDVVEGAAAEEEVQKTADIVANLLKFKVHHGRKDTYTIEMGAEESVDALKTKLQQLTNVPPALQKLVVSGVQLKDNTISLAHAKIKNNSKLLLIGSTLEEVSDANKVPTKAEIAQAVAASAPKKEPLCQQTAHKKVIDKGKPEDVMPGISNVQEPLPPAPLGPMRTKAGQVVRLSFKLEMDQLWIATNERTSKVNMSDISDIVSEPIDSHPGYHIMGLKLGTTEQSRLWIYWVPAQFVSAIKRTVLN